VTTADRFNEEQATYTVRGSDKPDLEAGVAAIRNVLRTLPVRPGVYRMLDAKGDVLYVGKARALKSRVINYTQVTRLSKRLQRMVAQTRDMLIVTTNTEAEALLLEAQLIKRYRPPYNVLLRDDKSFPFILLREDHAFPRAQLHRGARRAKGQYYGTVRQRRLRPHNADRAAEAVSAAKLHGQLFRQPLTPVPALSNQALLCSVCGADRSRRLFGARRRRQGLPRRPLDAGPGTARQADGRSGREYGFRACRRLPRPAARAYLCQGTQTIYAEGLGDADIFALACRDGAMCIQAFFIRGGQNWGHRSFFPAHTAEVPEDEVLAAFLTQFYEEVPAPKTILLDRDLAEAELLAEAFSERAERKVALRMPQRGDHVKMIRQAKRNAEEALERRLAESTTQNKNLRALAELFSLPEPPAGSRFTTTATSRGRMQSAR
jgi:excinuclease ABC subunit C